MEKSETNNKIDSTISQYIESIKTKIQEISNLPQPTEIFDQLQSTLKVYINELLSVTKCLNILSNNSFQEIFLILLSKEETLDYSTIFGSDPSYARVVCYRSFDLLSSSVITDFLNGKYPDELFPHVAYILRAIIHFIQITIAFVSFKKNDLQNQIPNIHLLIKYIDKNLYNTSQTDMPITIDAIFNFFWVLADDTILAPDIIEASCPTYVLKWISAKDLSLDIQGLCLNIIHNLARHEKGVKVLNDNNCINILKEFKQRSLDPNITNEEELYVKLRLVYCMALSLLTEPKENREDLDNLRKILDQLMQLAVDAGQSEDDKCDGFHVSEPIVVLTKLCVHDEILNYVLNESSVQNMKTKTKIEFFCQLLINFRGALAGENDLDQLTLTALLNIIWSISFHDQYIEQLKSDSKFLMTVKSLANDDGEALVEQYVPHHMSSISKAASGILWNLDEDNPGIINKLIMIFDDFMFLARAVRTTTVQEEKKTTRDDNKKSNRIRVMVSYCHADQEFCHQLVDGLRKGK